MPWDASIDLGIVFVAETSVIQTFLRHAFHLAPPKILILGSFGIASLARKLTIHERNWSVRLHLPQVVESECSRMQLLGAVSSTNPHATEAIPAGLPYKGLLCAILKATNQPPSNWFAFLNPSWSGCAAHWFGELMTPQHRLCCKRQRKR